ncbi:hypothetical protein BDV96DRAFT_272103 [Lophiotrema nucula]|uniref:Uncharacterized protein n=1 Tax=Lophiotrema nucula TaxID=690887 RepID=A0A6A5ZP64_9PLEO|nr:hypothetical protein BDV96DRAFT_272103 [Lophiotrema nucula]
MADIAYDDVYLGPWVDHSEGPIKGAKITLTSTNGAILIAFLALFVQYVGQHLWEIACFAWHQSRSSQLPKLVLQYQQDIALRNNGPPAQTLLYFTRIAWAWRHTRKQIRGFRYFRIAVVPLTLPFLFVALLVAAGILSSSIIDSTNVSILLRGDKCGLWQIPTMDMLNDPTNTFTVENGKYLRRTGDFGRTYARKCYNNTDAHQSPSCQSFAKASIPFTTTLTETCPFNSTTCQLPDSNARLDTGQIDSNALFGINSKTDNINFRRVMTCAPIKPDMFTRRLNYTLIGTTTAGKPRNESQYIIHWLYGPFLLMDTDATAYANSLQATQITDYTHDVIVRYPMDERIADIPDQSIFVPRDEFNRTDGDTQFVFLSGNRVLFSQPCDDPWFSAHEPYLVPNTTSVNGFLSDHLAVPMGCIEQYQFCNPHAPNQPCTPLAGIVPATAEAFYNLKLNPVQNKTVDLIFNAVYALQVNIGLGFLPNQPDYLAMDSDVSAYQLPLPKNQWVIELQYGMNKILTMMQRVIVDYAQGPGSVEAQQFIVKPSSTEQKALCGKIRAKTNGRFSNVSTYGLAITLILGTLIVLVNTFLAPILVKIRSYRKTGSFKTDRWTADSMFQLQKANFATNVSSWEPTEAIPYTRYVDTVKRFDVKGKRGSVGLGGGGHGDVELSIQRNNNQETFVAKEEGKESPTVKVVHRMDSLDTIEEHGASPVSPVSPVDRAVGPRGLPSPTRF